MKKCKKKKKILISLHVSWYVSLIDNKRASSSAFILNVINPAMSGIKMVTLAYS